MMLAFLKERLPLDMHAILLSDLLIHLNTDQDKFINPNITAVIPLLKTLSEKGLIVFIPSEDPYSSWVVRDKESILKNVNGALFADPVLKISTGLASTTGIISTAVLKKAFPDYNCDMITQFMVHFEIGQVVDLSQIKSNMAPEGSTSSVLGPLLFIPALVSIDRPSSATVPNNSFCWFLSVKSDQFFTPRFHHVLLHRLPLEFALPDSQTTSQPLNCLCDVWSRGIKWLSETGVTTIVEMSESFQAISLTMSSPNKASSKYLKLSHSVREVIRKARQEFCPYLEVLEVVFCPPECSSDHSIDTRVELSRLRKAILEKDTHIVDVSGNKSVAIDEWKKMEPHLSSLVEACTLTGQVLPPVEEPSARQPLSEMIGQVVEKFQGGHDKQRITICLAAFADGTKLKPFVVFKGKRIPKEISNVHAAVIKMSDNGWMNEDLTMEWIATVWNDSVDPGSAKRMLVWDTFKCHFTSSVKSLLEESNTDIVAVPGGCTKILQPADVSWNAPFKARYRDLYTAWMSAQNHERTKAGNLRAPSKALMVDWVLRSWESLSSETIRHSFDVCGVTSCDPKVIHYTKEGGLENDAHQRLVKFMQSPPDADDSEEDESEVDDEWSLTQGSDNEDGLDGVEDSEDEVVDSHEID
eukprot:Em0002g1811a